MTIRFKIFPVGPNKAPLVSSWQTKATRDPHTISQWKAHGAQAWGIPCGADNDLFVVDLDVDKKTGEPLGANSLAAMPRYAHLLDFANVQTPSSGQHIYLQHFKGARNSTSKLGPGIDTRGEGGYAVAPGSFIQSGKYVGQIPMILPPVPMGMKAMLIGTPTLASTLPRSELRLGATGEVEELLSYISADLPYSDWVSVLMALHDRYGGSEVGLALADQWSRAGTKYRNGEVRSKWRSFKGNGIGWATVPAMARQSGANLSKIAKKWSS